MKKKYISKNLVFFFATLSLIMGLAFAIVVWGIGSNNELLTSSLLIGFTAFVYATFLHHEAITLNCKNNTIKFRPLFKEKRKKYEYSLKEIRTIGIISAMSAISSNTPKNRYLILQYHKKQEMLKINHFTRKQIIDLLQTISKKYPHILIEKSHL